jgi:hypothetical protein
MRTEKTDSVSLESNFHAVDEHEFRRNVFHKKDSTILLYKEEIQEFYDYIFSSAHVFNTRNSDKLATIKFTISSTQMKYQRIVKNIMDWISSIGGVFGIFLVGGTFIIGGYSTFS